MKSYNHLWEKLISEENILQAIQAAAQGNMKRRKLTLIKESPHKYVQSIRNYIINYKTKKHIPKIINDGISAKKREIIVPSVEENLVQHCVMRILKPIFSKGMYEHSYASVPRRGCHKGMEVVKKWIYNDQKNTKYCLKLDIKKYFDSISQQVLIKKLTKKIHDKQFLDLLIKIIRTTEKGLPLGFYTSQWFANFYLQDFDYYVKQQLKIKYYIRYMDDMVFFDSDKKHLHQIKNQIEEYLNNKLHLTIKENWQVFLMHNKNEQGRFLDFMGFRFYRNRVTLRRKMVLKAMRKARKICKKGYATHYDAKQLLTYKGWIQKTNTFNLKWYIVYRISFYNLRKIISKHDKKINQGKI